MSGKLFVHIGLPKTATTSLQTDFFPAISGEHIEYVGVYQPREVNNQSELHSQFYDVVETGLGVLELRNCIDTILETGKSLIISEEVFTVSSVNTSWREKLRNLRSVLHGKDYYLLLTVREPVSAMFSFYLEVYRRFENRFDNFIDCALLDESMQIYHYKKLTDEIFSNFDHDRVYAFMFEDIVKNKVSKLQEIISPSFSLNDQIILSNHNQRENDKDFIYLRDTLTVMSFIRRVISWLGIGNTKTFARLKKVARPIIVRLDKLKLKSIKVPYLTQEEKDHLKLALKDETFALDKYFGIKYE